MSVSPPNAAAANATFELEALGEARNYRRALIREFGPWLRGRVLEVGSGIGQMTEHLAALPAVEELIAVEPEVNFCAALRRRVPRVRVVCGTLAGVCGAFRPDTIVSINVLEHIEDDRLELRRCQDLLRASQGYLCLFVPARPEIYAPLDRDFGHFRRYTRSELRQKLTQGGWRVVRMDYFNLLGYLAWWLSFCCLRRRGFDRQAVHFYDRYLFPLVYRWERWIGPPPLGQSLLTVAQAGDESRD